MTPELRISEIEDDISQLAIAGALKAVLKQGHTIYAHSSEDKHRRVMVQKSPLFFDHGQLLGFGEDGTAERALARALLTYSLHKGSGRETPIDENKYPESYLGQVAANVCVSRFDLIVRRGDFRLQYLREKDVYVAESSWARIESKPLRVSEFDPYVAIIALADKYKANELLSALPAFSL